MSEAVERKLIKLLNRPTTSPYGNPIPGLDKLDAASEPAPPAEADLVRLADVAKAGGGKVEIRRIAEHVQLDENLMSELRSVGVVPGRTVTVGALVNGASTVEVSDDTTTAQIPTSALHAVLAQAR